MKKILISRVLLESKIAICVRKIVEFSRNDRGAYGLSRAYLRLEVSSTGVVDGRRSEERRGRRMQSKLGIREAESGKA